MPRCNSCGGTFFTRELDGDLICVLCGRPPGVCIVVPQRDVRHDRISERSVKQAQSARRRKKVVH